MVKNRGDPGIEPGTSCTRNKNHTTRPIAQLSQPAHLSIKFILLLFRTLIILNTAIYSTQMLPTLLLITVLIAAIHTCEPNCASCRNLSPYDYYCLACSPSNELVSIYNICIQDNTIPNCAYYLQTLDCKYCKPTFSRESNVCNKMYDGCLISQNKSCSVCLPGSYLNSETGTCMAKYLNCVNISDEGVCVECSAEYVLKSGKCVYNNNNCSTVNLDSGLCSACTAGNTLIGFSCVPSSQANATANCYLVNKGSNTTCSYCKVGYGILYGNCIPFRDLIAALNTTDENCSQIQYITDNTITCLAATANSSAMFENCLVGDFGFRKCVICVSGYLFNSQNKCVGTLNMFCSVFDSNRSCTQCKKKFFLKDGKCYPFPNFCKTFTSSCTQCESGFQLMNGRCIDPNCQTVNNVTGICQICTINYQLNSQNLCKYIDANCRRTGAMGDCLQCQKGYTLKLNGLCAFQDQNCLTFSPISPGVCQLCKPEYFYNTQLQICILLPPYCTSLDISGRCNQCNSMYVLTSGYQCIYLSVRVPNCKMVNQADYTKCNLCIDGFFADNSGVCQVLPLFCSQFDANTNTCVQCSSNGVMKNGLCVDKNCLIFDTEGSCLACLQNYVFGNFGQCIVQLRDPNCKVYQFNICKMCAQRFYFNFQFNCVPVSPFCNTYDTNSGVCTSCYSGYQLSATGDCSIVMFNSIIYSSDILVDSSCKKVNSRNQCLECYSNYNAVPITVDNMQVVNCVQKIIENGYCLEVDRNGTCLQCVARMYLDETNTCKSIDLNCNEYNAKTGACKVCYPGYNISVDNVTKKTSCVIVNNQDPNCQTRSNTSGCVKCYQGYYYSLQTSICQQVDPQCASYNEVNGNCVSCYAGYKLKSPKCVLDDSSINGTATKNSTAYNGSKINTKNGTTNTSMDSGDMKSPNPNCTKYNFDTNMCTACQWGFALINGSCFLQDLNCKTFENPNSLKCIECYPGYKIFTSNQSQCVSQNLIVDNCLKYDQSVNCILCNKGFVLSPGTPGIPPNFVCNVIDQNCLVYNTTLNMCQQCNQGTVLEGRICVIPLYGLDVNCAVYQGGVCIKCKAEWILLDYLCTAK